MCYTTIFFFHFSTLKDSSLKSSSFYRLAEWVCTWSRSQYSSLDKSVEDWSCSQYMPNLAVLFSRRCGRVSSALRTPKKKRVRERISTLTMWWDASEVMKRHKRQMLRMWKFTDLQMVLIWEYIVRELSKVTIRFLIDVFYWMHIRQASN